MTVSNGINFYKMEGTGNDFVVINEKINLTVQQVKKICNRHYGVGCDQLIVVEERNNNTTTIRIFNSDGSQAFSCGNGIRCIGLLNKILYGDNESKVTVIGGNMTRTRVEKMYDEVSGLIYAELGSYKVSENDNGYIVEIGNKHLIIELDKISDADMGYCEYLSKKLNLNVSYVEFNTSKAVALTYERGAGLTNACGSAAAAIHITKKIDRETKIFFENSGEIVVAGGKEKIYIVADAKLVFSGIFYFKCDK